MLRSEHHRLEVEATLVGQHTRDVGEEIAVDLSCCPAVCSSGEQKCSNAPRLATASNGPKRLARDEPRVGEVDVEPVPATRRELRGGERDADPVGATTAHDVEQRSPSAPEVEDASTGSDPDLLGDVLVLARLRLFEGQREVAVVLRPAEVGDLAQAQSEHAIDQRIRELEVVAISHGCASLDAAAGAVNERDPWGRTPTRCRDATGRRCTRARRAAPRTAPPTHGHCRSRRRVRSRAPRSQWHRASSRRR